MRRLKGYEGVCEGKNPLTVTLNAVFKPLLYVVGRWKALLR